jgi:hypothetical protein
LLVNREVREEAEKILYTGKVFVLISFQWPNLASLIHSNDVPIVTENQGAISRFDHYSMRLHLRHRDCPKNKAMAYRVRSILVLLRDLPVFCRAVRWNSIIAPSAGTLLIKGRNDPVHLIQPYVDHTVQRHFQLSIRLQPTQYVRLFSELQEQLAHPLKELRVAGMKTVENVASGQSIMRQDLLKSIKAEAGA